MSTIRLLVGLVVAFASHSALCAEIEELSVSKDGPTLNTRVQFVIEVPYEAVLDAFTDFDRLAELNPAVVASNGENLPNGDTRVSTLLRDCVALFCRTVAIVEDVSFNGDDKVIARLVPEISDFIRGHSHWQFHDLGDRTRIQYASQMTPDFWIPPLVGSRALRGTLRRQIEAMADHLESRGPDRRSRD